MNGGGGFLGRWRRRLCLPRGGVGGYLLDCITYLRGSLALNTYSRIPNFVCNPNARNEPSNPAKPTKSRQPFTESLPHADFLSIPRENM